MPGTKPDISNLKRCTEDCTALESDLGPDDPTKYNQLRDRLEDSRDKLPPLYREKFYEPFVNTLDGLGETGFTDILLNDPGRTRGAGLMLDIAHSIIQNGEDYNSDSYRFIPRSL